MEPFRKFTPSNGTKLHPEDKTPVAPTADFSGAPTEKEQLQDIFRNVLDEKLKPVVKGLYDLQAHMATLEQRLALAAPQAPNFASYIAIALALLALVLR